MLWAALTMMDRVPVKDGRPCTFKVVRVSGTIRKAEEEAIRQARTLILAAKSNRLTGGFFTTMPNQEDNSMLENVVDPIDEMDTDEDDG